jgi:hypothetical protein
MQRAQARTIGLQGCSMALFDDRQVRQLSPSPEKEAVGRTRLFSEYADAPNVILLGDPGAGKTYLFRAAAAAQDAKLLTARAFLNAPSIGSSATLFIDGLDEKRSGRGDHGTIDDLVRKLFDTQPSKVRISCRAQEWLGETDLVAVRQYFDESGGVIVLELEQLTIPEQLSVLASREFPNPSQFLDEAVSRGLGESLGNPQNLIMLADVVAGDKWPANRTDLFDRFSRLLLSEHNKAKMRSGAGVYGTEELLPAAGNACAVRLISDCDGIGLTEADVPPDCPSFRSINVGDHALLQSALGRRLFVGQPNSESVDYEVLPINRTVT